jgi:septation ring formation regulator EzrA
MSSSSYNDNNNKSRENDKRLQNIIEQSRRDFDDLMKRESANLIQFYQDKFEQEIRQYEECNRKGDYIRAFYHYDFAHSINEYLKALESVHTK